MSKPKPEVPYSFGTSVYVKPSDLVRYNRLPRGLRVRHRMNEIIAMAEPDEFIPAPPMAKISLLLTEANRNKLDSIPDAAKGDFLRKCLEIMLGENGV